MRKNIFIALAALMTLAVSCKKNNIEKTDNGNMNPVVQTDNSSVAKLLKFKKQVEYYKANPNIKDGETMSIEEAVWNLENLFNVTYTFPEYGYSELVTQEFSLDIASDNGLVLCSDVAALYEELKDESRELYANDGFTDNKGFLTLHAEMDNTRGGETVKVKITTGEKINYNLPPEPHPAGPISKCWKYKRYLGDCDGNDMWTGGDEQLQLALEDYNNSLQPQAQNGYRYVYINREVKSFDATIYPNMNLFYREDVTDECICVHEMNECYFGERYVIFKHIPQQYGYGEDFCVTNIHIEGRDKGTYLCHWNEIEYGERQVVSLNEFGESIDIMNEI